MKIVKENAECIRDKTVRMSRVQLQHIRDCARRLILGASEGSDELSESNGYADDSLLLSEKFLRDYRSISDSLGVVNEGKSSELDASERFVDGFARSFAAASRACLCRYIWEYKSGKSNPLELDDFFVCDSATPDMRIAYVKNSYSDTAYRHFSSVLKGSSVVYPGSFTAVCEEVYNNRAGFCILPYETSDEGALSAFRQLIIKYELVQIMGCSVSIDTAQGGTRVTRFALLSKAMRPSVLPSAQYARYLKIIIDSPAEGLLSDIYNAAQLNGLRHAKSESIPVAWDSERYSYAVTFSVGEGDLIPFLLYLSLEVEESAPDCLYAVV